MTTTADDLYWQEALEERAAFLEYDAGYDRATAERLAQGLIAFELRQKQQQQQSNG